MTDIADQLKLLEEAYSKNDLKTVGILLDEAGDKLAPEEAASFYMRALGIAQRFNEPDLEITILSNLGLIYAAQSKFEQAISYFAQALTLARQTNDFEGIRNQYGNLGNAY